MVSERIELPADGHVHAQLLAKVSLAVEHLSHERLAAGHVHVGHHVRAADNRQPAFVDELAKRGPFFRVTFQKRLHVADLIENKAVVGMGLQQPQRPQDIGQPHVEIFLAGLEYRPFPMRVRNVEENVLHCRRRSGRLGRLRDGTAHKRRRKIPARDRAAQDHQRQLIGFLVA